MDSITQAILLSEMEQMQERSYQLIRKSLSELDIRGIGYSVYGEDIDLKAMCQSKFIRPFAIEFVSPPPIVYSLNVFGEEKIPKEIRETMTSNLDECVFKIFGYSQMCEGLSVKTPEGLLAEDDFADITRLHLSEWFCEDRQEVLKTIADAFDIKDDEQLHISRIIKAEIVLASYFLEQVALRKRSTNYCFLIKNKEEFKTQNKLRRIDGHPAFPADSYLTDVITDGPKESFDILMPLIVRRFFFDGTVTRMLALPQSRDEILRENQPLPKFPGFYQLHEVYSGQN